MLISVEQLTGVSIFANIPREHLEKLCKHIKVQKYLQEEIIFCEGDELPAKLFAVLTGVVVVKKTGTTGKETILRVLSDGEMVAATALFGNGVASATVIAQKDCQILSLEQTVLLETIRQTPEVALQIMTILTQRLQHLHNSVHGLVSERAIVRLVRLLQATAFESKWDTTDIGDCLRTRLSHYQIARSIGITYEECVRLFKQLHESVSYRRGGKIIILDWKRLDRIASGEIES